MNVPLDQLHEDCIAAKATLRIWFQRLHDEVAQWEPRPCPHTAGLPELKEEP